MGRFDVYATPGQDGTGYVLDVQADLLQDLTTRVVVPLLPTEAAPKPA
jgi:toxin CcdB